MGYYLHFESNAVYCYINKRNAFYPYLILLISLRVSGVDSGAVLHWDLRASSASCLPRGHDLITDLVFTLMLKQPPFLAGVPSHPQRDIFCCNFDGFRKRPPGTHCKVNDVFFLEPCMYSFLAGGV